MIVYISGRITGNDNYKAQFRKARYDIEDARDVALDPTTLPEGLSYDQYMDIDMAMIRACDAIYVLKGYEGGKGSEAELAYAKCLGKQIIFQV